ncbi:Signal transduction histidine kinase [Clostridium cavendishii DSM 21758]|uniref:histidine kinase n=1 Tax=Clostridium cavendishii DSM 21758 TaxID=1121302 RepID=A0A1M6GCU3_9CLOT|nr:ATP-binding protein [Clostridium cavendishii]SHJ07706.1 Signal transduction histidine kinase [Clostridium cavendishii DSM 21758]
MKNLNLKIKTKIMLMNMGILIPAIVLIYIVTINNLYSNVKKSAIDFLTKESYNAQQYIANYIENDKETDIETNFVNKSELINTFLANKLSFRIQIYNKNGKILADSVMNTVSLYDEDITSAIKGNKAYVVKKFDGRIYILFSSPIYSKDKTLGCVRYIYPVDSGQNLINNMFIIMGIVGLVAIFISWLLSNIFSENIAGPINKLKLVSEKVAAGNYESKINIKSGDEIEDLAKTFNVMSESIESYIKNLKEEKLKQKEFLDNVTHEFKTPLTAIIGYSELIPRLEDKEDVDESLDYIKSEGERLLRLVEELLELSKLGKNEFNVERSENNLKEIVEETLSAVKQRLEKYDIALSKELFDIYLYIDRDKTKQVILNVLDNAIKYSECNMINIKLKRKEDKIILSIIDNGIGIGKHHLEKLFDPVYRVNKIHSRSKNGNGLGLSICKEIMKKQDGDIKVYSEEDKWTALEIIFKKSNVNL